MDYIDSRRLEPGEAEIVFAPVNVRTRKLIALRIAVFRHPVEVHAAGIIESHGARSLVHGLARRIVARSAYDVKIRIVAHLDYMAVTARNDERQKRRLKVGVSYIVRRDMRAQMVHGHERLVRGERESLCKIHADEQRTYQPGSIGHGYCVNVADLHFRSVESLAHNAGYRLRMAP